MSRQARSATSSGMREGSRPRAKSASAVAASVIQSGRRAFRPDSVFADPISGLKALLHPFCLELFQHLGAGAELLVGDRVQRLLHRIAHGVHVALALVDVEQAGDHLAPVGVVAQEGEGLGAAGGVVFLVHLLSTTRLPSWSSTGMASPSS